MQNILNQIQANIEAITAIILSLSALAVLIITKYKEIKDAIDAVLNAGKNKAIVQAIKPTVELITQAKDNPIGLANSLLNPEKAVGDQPIPSYVLNNPDEAKKNIVAQALMEKEPKLLKKMKLKDALQAGNFVSDMYQLVKPIIKSRKK